MDAVNIADVKEHLHDLIERAAAGESVEIIRDGQAVARIVPAARKPINIDALEELVSRLPPQTEGVVREMRDSARY